MSVQSTCAWPSTEAAFTLIYVIQHGERLKLTLRVGEL
jgi:hypothetical protein